MTYNVFGGTLNLAQFNHTCASVTNWYNLAPAKAGT